MEGEANSVGVGHTHGTEGGSLAQGLSGRVLCGAAPGMLMCCRLSTPDETPLPPNARSPSRCCRARCRVREKSTVHAHTVHAHSFPGERIAMHVRVLPAETQTDRCMALHITGPRRPLTGPPHFPPAATKPQRLVASFRQSFQAAVLGSNMSAPPRAQFETPALHLRRGLQLAPWSVCIAV